MPSGCARRAPRDASERHERDDRDEHADGDGWAQHRLDDSARARDPERDPEDALAEAVRRGVRGGVRVAAERERPARLRVVAVPRDRRDTVRDESPAAVRRGHRDDVADPHRRRGGADREEQIARRDSRPHRLGGDDERAREPEHRRGEEHRAEQARRRGDGEPRDGEPADRHRGAERDPGARGGDAAHTVPVTRTVALPPSP